MGVIERILGQLFGRVTASTVASATSVHTEGGRPSFAVIDVETTGLSPRGDRILELAVVRVDSAGRIVDEWVTRFNPQGPVGATHIHGIQDADVADAPLFSAVAPTIASLLSGIPIVAHNAKFDLAFLRAEFAAAGWEIPRLSSYCTLDGSHHYFPDLDRRRLADCCSAAGVRLENAHSALGDARAAAALLRMYLGRAGSTPLDGRLLALPGAAATADWPSGPSTAARAPGVRGMHTVAAARPIRITAARPELPPLIQQITAVSLLELIEEGAPVGTTAYLERLLAALEDGVISESEAAELDELGRSFDLDEADVRAAHRAFLLALAHHAVHDGRVSHDERRELKTLAELLSVPVTAVKDVLDQADAARIARLSAGLRPLPASWSHGMPLRVGDRVAFTGCDDVQRDRLERRAEELGIRVMSSVSRLTAMLITDGTFNGSKHAKATEHGTRLVHPDVFETLIEHLQPAIPTVATSPLHEPTAAERAEGAAVSSSAAAPEPAVVPASGTRAPHASVVRAWALANGLDVGTRGRIPEEMYEAYRQAQG